MNSAGYRLLPALALLLVCDTPGFSQPDKPQPDKPMQSLARLEPGLWEIRVLGSKQPARNLCVSDPTMLIQIQHPQSPCSRFIIADDAEIVTVHYTCAANGYGRTSVRVETPKLARIDTQGLLDKTPFAYRAEARRIGSCDGHPSPSR